jgi:serine/threonine protein kinase
MAIRALAIRAAAALLHTHKEERILVFAVTIKNYVERALAPETWSQWALVILASVTAYYAIRGFIQTRRQSDAAEGALEESKKASEHAERAVRLTERADILLEKAGVVGGQLLGKQTQFVFAFKNFGRTRTKLGRSVAIKFLPEAFSHNSERVARFQREAEVLAQLNHPNIAVIYGLEESNSKALVLELVEGPTVGERIAQGPIPVDETLQIAKQIADALEYAHEQGVIHRDLKPANIKLKPDGTVKVLDFGLAKALNDDARSPVTSNSPTLSLAATQAGVILGTAAYFGSCSKILSARRKRVRPALLP